MAGGGGNVPYIYRLQKMAEETREEGFEGFSEIDLGWVAGQMRDKFWTMSYISEACEDFLMKYGHEVLARDTLKQMEEEILRKLETLLPNSANRFALNDQLEAIQRRKADLEAALPV